MTHPSPLPVALRELLEPASAAELARAVEGIAGSTLLVLEAETASFAALVATALGRSLAPLADQRVFAPEGDRYLTEELDGLLLAAALRPEQRNVLVVTAADTIAPELCSRLLRTVEQPAAETVFLVALAHRDRLGAPLLGRAQAVVRLEGRGDEAVLAALRTRKLQPATAARLVELCLPRPELALVLAETHAEPVLAVQGLEAVMDLGVDASMAALTDAVERLEGLTNRKDVQRDLLRVWLARAAGVARTKLAAKDPDGLTLVAAVERAGTLVARYASPASVLSTVTCR